MMVAQVWAPGSRPDICDLSLEKRKREGGALESWGRNKLHLFARQVGQSEFELIQQVLPEEFAQSFFH